MEPIDMPTTLVRTFRSLGPIDARSVQRDPLLRYLPLIPLLVALLARYFLPFLVAKVESAVGVTIQPYYAPIMGYILLILSPILVGAVIGFLLLDQRDDRTMEALQVTPLSPAGYLAYRLAMPSLLSLIITLLALPISGLVSGGMFSLLIAALAAAPLAPLMALAYGSFAQNKVQGFALQKASGVILLPPIAAYFLPAPWHWLLGIFPNYWAGQLFWQPVTAHPLAWLFFIIGLAYQALLARWLLRRFEQVTHS